MKIFNCDGKDPILSVNPFFFTIMYNVHIVLKIHRLFFQIHKSCNKNPLNHSSPIFHKRKVSLINSDAEAVEAIKEAGAEDLERFQGEAPMLATFTT